MKKKFLLAGTIMLSSLAYSQVGINTKTPKATFDVIASPTDPVKIDGIIAPRLTGTELKAKDGLYSNEQTAAIVYITEALTAVATSAKTINVTEIGYYYFDGTIWQKINAIYKEPWYNQADNTPANTNLQNIYQTGSVAIGKNEVYTGSKLDVQGSVRGGDSQGGVVGVNSAAFGEQNEASGDVTFAAGRHNVITGAGSASVGAENTISGIVSFSAGSLNKITGNNSMTLGDQNTITSNSSVTFGRSNSATADFTTVMGFDNAATNGYDFAGGYGSTASGGMSFVYGSTSYAEGFGSVALGQECFPKGRGSFAQGWGSVASNAGEISIGMFNLLENSDIVGQRSIFQLGNGNDNNSRSSLIVAVADNVDINQGWVAIGSGTTMASKVGSERLRVYGSIQTAGGLYPDYVFDNYFGGASIINPKYKFISNLYQVENFIKENRHLPGVTSIKDLEKTKDGYSFNLTDLSTQTLEKVEELYLYTIEQQKLIDAQKTQLNEQQIQINQLIQITNELKAKN